MTETDEQRIERLGPHLFYWIVGEQEIAVQPLLFNQARIVRGPVGVNWCTEEWMYATWLDALDAVNEWVWGTAAAPTGWTRYTASGVEIHAAKEATQEEV